jgi:hypothetical protein
MNAKRDWISSYSPEPIKKFQEGGPMAPPAGPPAGPEAGAPPAGPAGGDIEAMIAEYAQTKDPQLAVAICDMIVEMMGQGGAEGAPAGPEGAEAPMAKKGMKMKRGPVFKGTADKKKAKC